MSEKDYVILPDDNTGFWCVILHMLSILLHIKQLNLCNLCFPCENSTTVIWFFLPVSIAVQSDASFKSAVTRNSASLR